MPYQQPSNFLVGVAPPTMELNRSLGEEHCGIGLDYFGYFYVNGRYFHVSNLSNWSAVAKPVRWAEWPGVCCDGMYQVHVGCVRCSCRILGAWLNDGQRPYTRWTIHALTASQALYLVHSVACGLRGSTAKHKGKAAPIFTFVDGKCEVTLTLDLKEGTLKFSTGARAIGTIAGIKGPLHAAVTITSSRQSVGALPSRSPALLVSTIQKHGSARSLGTGWHCA